MWTSVAKVTDIQEGKSLHLQLGQQQIALFRMDGKLHAIDGFCPHRGGPLGQGHMENGVVTCPWHAWTFDIQTGKCNNVPKTKQRCFPVRTEADNVLIDI